jgi:hypothetical protein
MLRIRIKMNSNNHMGTKHNPLTLGATRLAPNQASLSFLERKRIISDGEGAKLSLPIIQKQIVDSDRITNKVTPVVGAGLGLTAFATGAYYGYNKYSTVGALGMGLFNLVVAGGTYFLGKEYERARMLRIQNEKIQREYESKIKRYESYKSTGTPS